MWSCGSPWADGVELRGAALSMSAPMSSAVLAMSLSEAADPVACQSHAARASRASTMPLQANTEPQRMRGCSSPLPSVHYQPLVQSQAACIASSAACPCVDKGDRSLSVCAMQQQQSGRTVRGGGRFVRRVMAVKPPHASQQRPRPLSRSLACVCYLLQLTQAGQRAAELRCEL